MSVKKLSQSLGAVATVTGDWSGEILDFSAECRMSDYQKHREQMTAERRRN